MVFSAVRCCLSLICMQIAVQATTIASEFYKPSPGLLQENWPTSSSYGGISKFASIPNYPDCPTTTENKDKFEWNGPTSQPVPRVFYNKRFRSYFVSPETGGFRFFVACNAACEVAIQLNPGVKTLINQAGDSTFGWNPSKWSNFFKLTKGFRYKVEALYFGKGESSNFFMLGVKFPNGTEMKPVDSRVLRRSMEFYAANHLLVEQYGNITCPNAPDAEFKYFIKAPENAAIYPYKPSAFICRSTLYDTLSSSYRAQYPLRYTGYFRASATYPLSFSLQCNNFCAMNFTNSDTNTVYSKSFTKMTTGQVKFDVGKAKKDMYYKIELFLCGYFNSSMKLQYSKERLSSNPLWRTNWPGLLVNLLPSETKVEIPTPVVNAVNSTAISVKIPSLPTMPTRDLWSSNSAYDIVYWMKNGSKTTVAVSGAVPLTKNITNLKKFTSYSVNLHFYGKIDSEISYNMMSWTVNVATLEDVPSAPPESFKGNSTDAKSIALQWKEIPSSQRNGVITGYKVLFRTNIGSQMWNQTTTAGDKLSVTVQNLQANVVYDFKIAGLTKDGIGPYSNVITIKVKGPVHVAKVPTAAPESFKGNPVDATTIALTWKEIPSSKRNGVITGYRVQFWPKSASLSSSYLNVAGDKLAVIVENLQVNFIYEFNIAGKTKDGLGPYSSPITIELIKPKVHNIVQHTPTACITNIQFTDKALINHVASTIQVNTLRECFMACLDCIQSKGGCMCLSFNLLRLAIVEGASAVRFKCEINDSNNILFPLDFVEKKGCQFYQVM